MTKYVISFASYYFHKPELIKNVLCCPILANLLLPAKLYINTKDYELLNSPNDFDISIVPKEYFSGPLVRVPLTGLNGVEFACTLQFDSIITPNIISVLFTNDHLAQGVITLEILKSLFAEIVPIFRADSGRVYDQSVVYRAGRRAFFTDQDFRTYPATIEWITFFGSRAIELIGQERLNRITTYAEKYYLNDGVVIVLIEEPFSEQNYNHKQLQMSAENEIRLQDL